MAKRILIFSTTYMPFVGGAEIAVRELTKRIDASVIEFDMITIRFNSELSKFERVGNVNIYRIGFTRKDPSMKDLIEYPLVLNKYLFPIMGLLKAWTLHWKHRYDATWSIMASYAGFASVLFSMSYPSIPYILTLQEGDPIEYIKRKVGITYPLFKRIFSRAAYIQVISSYLGKFATEMGSKKDPIVVPNAVDLSLFSNPISTSVKKDIRKKFDVSEGDTLLITISRLVKKNAVADVINSLLYLPATIKLLIIGSGPLENSLHKLTDDTHLSDRVHFIGTVSYDELPQYLQSADIFVRPSLSEGMGNSFIEAMAAGIPVIGTRVGGITDFLYAVDNTADQAPTGFVCGVKDPESIAHQVQKIISDRTTVDSICANAQKMVREKYTWDMSAEKMRREIFKPLFKIRHNG